MGPQPCRRLRLSTSTKRRLWSESGGYCQNPSCRCQLFTGESDADFAEMAHIIPASIGGPRDVPTTSMPLDQRAHHSNIVVLCANCHTVADKEPAAHPETLMRVWKNQHAALIAEALGTPTFTGRDQARRYIERPLAENRAIHENYAPAQGEFSDARANRWHNHVVRTIIPNNALIRRALTAHSHLLDDVEKRTVDRFVLHSSELEHRHLLNDWTAGASRFPDGLHTILTK